MNGGFGSGMSGGPFQPAAQAQQQAQQQSPFGKFGTYILGTDNIVRKVEDNRRKEKLVSKRKKLLLLEDV